MNNINIMKSFLQFNLYIPIVSNNERREAVKPIQLSITVKNITTHLYGPFSL